MTRTVDIEVSSAMTFGKNSGSPNMISDVAPVITIIVPVRNEERFIRNTLSQLVDQDYPSDQYEIIVVDGVSDDKTATIAEECSRCWPSPKIRVLTNAKKLSSSARNIGVRAAAGRYLLIIDGHVHIPTRSLLSDMAEVLKKGRFEILGRPQYLTPPGLTRFQEVVAGVRASKIGHSGESHIYSAEERIVSPTSVAILYSHKIFPEIGYFDETFDAAEDLEFNHRLDIAGYECWISPKFEVTYYPRDRLRGLFKQMQRYGDGRARFYLKYPQRLRLNAVVPALFLLTIAALVIMSITLPLFARLLFILLGAYAILAMYFGLQNCKKHWTTWIYILPVSLTIHLGLGWGLLKGAFLQIFRIERRQAA